MITKIIEQLKKLDDTQIKELAAEIFKFDETIATSIAFTISCEHQNKYDKRLNNEKNI